MTNRSKTPVYALSNSSYAFNKRGTQGISYDYAGFSTLPGSKSLKYYPKEPALHRYGVKRACPSFFKFLQWKGECRLTDEIKEVIEKLQ